VNQTDAQKQLRAIAAGVRQFDCPWCGTRRGYRCRGSPEIGHADRIKYAAAMLGYPQEFLRWEETMLAAFPLPLAPEPEITADGLTVLWRAAQAEDPRLGRGTYWTHSRQCGETYAAGLSVSRQMPVPYVLYRAEVLITNQNSLEVPDDMCLRSRAVDKAITADPSWPGTTWLRFRDPDPDNTRPAAYRSLLQYVYCGDQPVAATPARPYKPVAQKPPRRRPRPGPAAAQQWFRLGPWLFDINGADRLLAATPRSPQPVPVQSFIRAYSPLFGGKPASTLDIAAAGKGFDPTYAMQVADPAVPVLVVTLPASDERLLPPSLTTTLPRDSAGRLLVLADGKHRLFRAHAAGLTCLPAYVLAEDETVAIRGTHHHAPATWNLPTRGAS
jgi:hypothetical protein